MNEPSLQIIAIILTGAVVGLVIMSIIMEAL